MLPFCHIVYWFETKVFCNMLIQVFHQLGLLQAHMYTFEGSTTTFRLVAS